MAGAAETVVLLSRGGKVEFVRPRKKACDELVSKPTIAVWQPIRRSEDHCSGSLHG